MVHTADGEDRDYLVKKATGPTRLGPGKHEFIDAILSRDIHFTLPTDGTERLPDNPRVYGLLKGLFLTYPELYASDSATILIHLLHQAVESDSDAAWISSNSARLYRCLRQIRPARLSKIVTAIRNHDPDIQEDSKTKPEYLKWRKTAERTAAMARLPERATRTSLTEWSRKVRSGVDSISYANTIRTKKRLPVVPHLNVVSDDGDEATTPNIDMWESQSDSAISKGKNEN
jgi:hypothetical protein